MDDERAPLVIDLKNFDFPFSDVVVREHAIVTYHRPAAVVRVESVYPALNTIPPEPSEVSASSESADSWTIGGNHVTSGGGQANIRLHALVDAVVASGSSTIEGVDFTSHYLFSPISFTATAATDEPIFTTYTLHTDTYEPRKNINFAWEAIATVRTWTSDGEPAPHVRFSWICVAQVGQRYDF